MIPSNVYCRAVTGLNRLNRDTTTLWSCGSSVLFVSVQKPAVIVGGKKFAQNDSLPFSQQMDPMTPSQLFDGNLSSCLQFSKSSYPKKLQVMATCVTLPYLEIYGRGLDCERIIIGVGKPTDYEFCTPMEMTLCSLTYSQYFQPNTRYALTIPIYMDYVSDGRYCKYQCTGEQEEKQVVIMTDTNTELCEVNG